MKKTGIWLMVFGFGSMALHFVGMQFTVLMWIDNWGPAVAWAIRAALAVAGVVLFVLGGRQAQPAGKTA